MKHKTHPIAPVPEPNPIDLVRLPALADHVLAGDVVQPASIPELCALLEVLRQRGYALKRRTEWEQRAGPWLLLVVPVPVGTRGEIS